MIWGGPLWLEKTQTIGFRIRIIIFAWVIGYLILAETQISDANHTTWCIWLHMCVYMIHMSHMSPWGPNDLIACWQLGWHRTIGIFGLLLHFMPTWTWNHRRDKLLIEVTSGFTVAADCFDYTGQVALLRWLLSKKSSAQPIRSRWIGSRGVRW